MRGLGCEFRLTMTIKACSFTENFPGLMSNDNAPSGTLHRGSFSQARPIGNTNNCATTYPILKEGCAQLAIVLSQLNMRIL